MKLLKFVLICVLFCCTASSAQAKIGIFVEAQSKDYVGLKLKEKLLERLDLSDIFFNSVTEDNIKLKIYMLTIDPDGDQKRTSYSLTWLIDNSNCPNGFRYFYLGSQVGVCSEFNTDQTAQEIIDGTKSIVDEVKKYFE
ncbi:MAG: hypothetical protein LHW64_09970 [Candidatus Cloacimonetes bacterium]|nr:hypothetical protein [Candidatus Cloacimonadota bacterium]MDY0230438.1 hypothetical protein [Candidatus Cloacimonadaceae bacterium]